MTLFNDAFGKTMGHEGGYCNDPDDRGGETYRGIARRFHTTWAGWEFIDGQKAHPSFDQSDKDFSIYLSQFTELDHMVRLFYKGEFWDRFWGDEFDHQRIANELFDTAVNMGSGTAIGFLQQTLNALNRNQKLWPDLKVDGGMGPKTFAAYSQLPAGDEEVVLKMLNVMQGARYLEIMDRDPVQEKYARGWFNRVSISKE